MVGITIYLSDIHMFYLKFLKRLLMPKNTNIVKKIMNIIAK